MAERNKFPKTHGMWSPKSAEYRCWSDMKQRCINPNNRAFKNYGGRGISVCDRWKDNFLSFISDMGARPPGMSLDRIDPNGNYEPSNCRWADAITQSRNTRAATSESAGVYFEVASGKWVAGIAVKGRSIRVGSFDSKEAAINARAQARAAYWDAGQEPLPRGSRKNNQSGHIGLYMDKRYGSWTAYYGGRGRRVHIGTFASAQEALAARNDWLRAHGIGPAPAARE